MGNIILARCRSRSCSAAQRHVQQDSKGRVQRSCNVGSAKPNDHQECVLLRPVHVECVTALAMAGEGCVISGGKDAVVAMTNYGSGECMGKWNAHKRDITKVAYGEHSCQPYVFSACRDGAVVLWTPTDRMPQQQFQGHELAASGLVPSMDCVHLCTGSRDNTIRMWDVTTGKCLTSQHLAQNLITHVAWRSDVASFIAQSSEDKELKLWDSRDLSMICAFPKKQYIQMHCDISFDAQYCVTCSNGFNANGCELTVWDVRQRRMLREYYGHQQSTNCAIFGKDATGRNLLISVSSDHTVRLWSADGNELIWTEYIASGGSILTAAVRETEIAMIRNIVLVVLVAITIEAIENPDAEGAHAEYPLTRLGLVSHPYYPVWANFKNAFRKSYLTMEEELARFRTFVGHHKKIDQHNIEYGAGSKSYQVQMNQFGDMPTDEFRAKMNGFKPSLSAKTKRGLRSIHFANGTSPLPESVDWRQKGYVTKVKNQGNCGSCWSFSTTGALEGQQFKKTGKLIELSEQNLVDCDHENYGCDGGLMDLAFEYIQRHGINTESEYPYTARDGRCRFRKGNTVTVDNGFADLPEDDEAALEAAIANVGPISVAIDANQWSFQFYSQGVYDEPSCTEDLDHAVLAVGYGATEKGEKYYIVKNSWSEEWGEEGYILMSRRKNNQCGIAKMASYPLVQ